MTNALGESRLSVLAPAEIDALEENVHFFDSAQGNRLAWHEYGTPDGHPVIFYHGTGSHVHGMLLDEPARELGFRIIAPDRPGVARSEYRPGWTVLDYARDMADLADSLGIDRFAAIGISGAGPTLMASAFAIPERLHCIIDLACAMPVYDDPEMTRDLGSMDRVYAKLGTRLPLAVFRLPFALLGIMQTIMKSPASFAKMFDSSLCPADKEIFAGPEFQYLFMRDFQELYRQGSKGPAYDALTVYGDWGFDLGEIKAHVDAYHGTADQFVPVKFSDYLARHAPDVDVVRIEGKGHFHHLAYGHEMLARVAATHYAA